MKVITNNHKTKDAIIESNLTRATIICANEVRVEGVIRFAKYLDIDIPAPVSISNTRRLAESRDFNGRIIIDDLVDVMSIVVNRHIITIDMITYRKEQRAKEERKSIIARLIDWISGSKLLNKEI